MFLASIFLGLSLLASTAKSIVGKKVSIATNTVNDVSFFHGVRMVICVVIGAALVLIFDGPKGFIIDWRTLIVAAITGFGFALNIMFWAFSQRRGAYVISDVMIVVSSIIPIVLSYVFYQEAISVVDIIGYLVVIGGCFLIVTYNNQINKKVTFALIAIYIVYIIATGVSDFGRKVFQVDSASGVSLVSANGFTFYSVLFSLLTFVIFYAFTFKKASVKYQKSIFWKEFIYVAIAAVMTYAYSYLLVPASVLPTTILFLVKNGGGLIINVIVAAFLFKEKPTPRLFIGIGITIAAIVMIGLF
ncbi:MAG: EamA family transporter [Bacilli bacterium]|nr:EamA family transporter [Bacilli bacterium]